MTIHAVIGQYSDYLSVHYSKDSDGKYVPDYSLGPWILPDGYTGKDLTLTMFGSFVKAEDFA